MLLTHEQTARRLRDAYSGAVLPPLRDALDPTDGDGAYAVQEINTEYWQRQGRQIIGRKIGLTAKAVQKQLGVDQPDFGTLFDDMLIPDGGLLDPNRVIQPKAEAEVAFVLGKDLQDPEATAADVEDAVSCAVAAIEIVDSRIAEWKISFADTVADNGSSAYFVLGERRAPLQGLDLYSCGMVLERNGEVASIGAGAACLGHPLEAAAWLARILASRGSALRKGDIVLTGALGPMVPVAPRDHMRATIGGLGEVAFCVGDRP